MRIIRQVLIAGLALASTMSAPMSSAHAETCSSDQLGAEVDKAGSELRAFNATNMQAFDAKLRILQQRRGWSDSEHIEQVAALFQTPDIIAIDHDAFKQYSAIEDLSSSATGAVDCTRLDALRGRVQDLLKTMERKRVAMSVIIDSALSPVPPAPPVVPANPVPLATAVAPAQVAAKPSEKKVPAAAEPVKVGSGKPAAIHPPKPPIEVAAQLPVKLPVNGPVKPSAPPADDGQAAPWRANAAFDPDQPPPAMPPVASVTVAGIPAVFSVDEIKSASQGLFGSFSAQLASVIAHSFEKVGSPNGYIMGDEGGGAFLAGLRYGTGKLYLKDGSERRVYWRGPSIGLDVGASGARTLFLVYNLKNPDDVFAVVSGVDGSAYVIGGVGMTVLTDGDIVMAPISTGMGLRLGANAGYLRFSAKESWLPF